MTTRDLYEEHCKGCGKILMVGEFLVGCDLYCDDCPFPKDPCETCGKPECDGSCCLCEYCVERRTSGLNPVHRAAVKTHIMFQKILEAAKKKTVYLLISAEDLALQLIFPPTPRKTYDKPASAYNTPGKQDTVGTSPAPMPKMEVGFIAAEEGEHPEPEEKQQWRSKDRRRGNRTFVIVHIAGEYAHTTDGYMIKLERFKKHYQYTGRLV